MANCGSHMCYQFKKPLCFGQHRQGTTTVLNIKICSEQNKTTCYSKTAAIASDEGSKLLMPVPVNEGWLHTRYNSKGVGEGKKTQKPHNKERA